DVWNNDHAEGPERTKGEDGPPLERLCGDEHGDPGRDEPGRRRLPGKTLREHRGEGERIRDPHQPVDVVGRLDAAPRALRPLVPRGAPGFNQHRGEDSNEENENRPRQRQPPSHACSVYSARTNCVPTASYKRIVAKLKTCVCIS